jgi:hypothetical protein
VTIHGHWHDVKTGTFLGWTKSGKAKARLHGLPYGSLSHRFVRNYEPRHVTLEIEEVTNEPVTRALQRRDADAERFSAVITLTKRYSFVRRSLLDPNQRPVLDN